MKHEMRDMTKAIRKNTGKNTAGRLLPAIRRVLPVIFFFISIDIYGQMSFAATVDRKKVTVNGNFQLTFKLTNADGNISPPSLSDFMVLQGPTRGAFQSMVNG